MSPSSAILRLIMTAAETGQPCPTNRELSDGAGVEMQTVHNALNRLNLNQTIRIHRGRSTRIIEIVASGQETLPGAFRQPSHRRTVPKPQEVRLCQPAPDRTPCPMCAVRADIGCDCPPPHWAVSIRPFMMGRIIAS